VNSVTHRGVKNRMFGPYFDSVERAAYATAVVAGSNTPS
jgi:hypothetical protein